MIKKERREDMAKEGMMKTIEVGENKRERRKKKKKEMVREKRLDEDKIGGKEFGNRRGKGKIVIR